MTPEQQEEYLQDLKILALIGKRFLEEACDRGFAKRARVRSPLYDGMARDGFRAVAEYMRELLEVDA